MPMLFNNLPTDQEHAITVGAIEVQFTYPDGTPCSGAPYELTLTQGGSRKGTLDVQGKFKEENIPPGAKGTVKLTGIPLLALSQ